MAGSCSQDCLCWCTIPGKAAARSNRQQIRRWAGAQTRRTALQLKLMESVKKSEGVLMQRREEGREEGKQEQLHSDVFPSEDIGPACERCLKALCFLQSPPPPPHSWLLSSVKHAARYKRKTQTQEILTLPGHSTGHMSNIALFSEKPSGGGVPGQLTSDISA
jgi:hypothetical protein